MPGHFFRSYRYSGRYDKNKTRCVCFLELEQLTAEWFLAASEVKEGSSEADVHFFLDFRLKAPYI